MKIAITILSVMLVTGLLTFSASAQSVPEWIKNNAAWWAEGTISESEFISAIQFLIKEKILTIQETVVSSETNQKAVPEWVKNNAAWWAEGTISENEFLNGIQHLIKIGIIDVSTDKNEQMPVQNTDTKLAALQNDLEKCSEIKRAYDRLQCEKTVESKITRYNYETNGIPYKVGPVTYYYAGNEFEITEKGQAFLTVKLLAVNTDSSNNITLSCSGPAICNYDVTNGDKVFKYASTDFTSGSITLKPDQSREFEIFFGPNIGYGGTTFEYDSNKDYFFRINESFGSASIPLTLE